MLERIFPSLLMTLLGLGTCLSFALGDGQTSSEMICGEVEADTALYQALNEANEINAMNGSVESIVGRYHHGEDLASANGNETVSVGLMANTRANPTK